MNTLIKNPFRRTMSTNCTMVRHILCITIFLFNLTSIQNAKGKIWTTTTTIDSVTVGNETLIGKLKRGSEGSVFYTYYVKRLKEKHDSIQIAKRPFDLEYTEPLYKNFVLFFKEKREHNDYVISIFENNRKGYTYQQMFVYIGFIIDEDGTSFCHTITSTMKLTDIFSAKELIEKVYQASTCTYTTPLVVKPKHGYLEGNYY